MKPLHERLATLLTALQSATARNDLACLELIQGEAVRIITEVKAIEESQLSHDDKSTSPDR